MGVAQPAQRWMRGWTGAGTVPPVPTKWRCGGWGHVPPPLQYKKGGAHGSFRSCVPPYYCPTTPHVFPLYSPPGGTPLQGRGGAHDLARASCVPDPRVPHLSHATLRTSPHMWDNARMACEGWGTQGCAHGTHAGSYAHAMREGHCFAWAPPPPSHVAARAWKQRGGGIPVWTPFTPARKMRGCRATCMPVPILAAPPIALVRVGRGPKGEGGGTQRWLSRWSTPHALRAQMGVGEGGIPPPPFMCSARVHERGLWHAAAFHAC